jgi:hypothetical protein
MVSGSAPADGHAARLARGTGPGHWQLRHPAEGPTARASLIAVAQRAQLRLGPESGGGCALHAATWKEGGFKLPVGKARGGAGGASSGFPSILPVCASRLGDTQATGRSGQVRYSAGPRSREMRATSHWQLAYLPGIVRCPNFYSDL